MSFDERLQPLAGLVGGAAAALPVAIDPEAVEALVLQLRRRVRPQRPRREAQQEQTAQTGHSTQGYVLTSLKKAEEVEGVSWTCTTICSDR